MLTKEFTWEQLKPWRIYRGRSNVWGAQFESSYVYIHTNFMQYFEYGATEMYIEKMRPSQRYWEVWYKYFELVTSGLVQILTRITWLCYVLKCLTDGGRDGRWCPALYGHRLSGTGCFGFNYYIDLYQMKWLTDYVQLHTFHWCFCPLTFVENTKMNSLLLNTLILCLLPN